MPLVVVVLNSLRSTEDIAHGGVIGLPHELMLEQFQPEPGAATASRSIATASSRISGTRMRMVIPATIISTLLGALNGYSLSLWRFRGDTIVFGIMTLGVFLPEQMRLVPWVIVLRDLGLFNTISGLVLIHIVQG